MVSGVIYHFYKHKSEAPIPLHVVITCENESAYLMYFFERYLNLHVKISEAYWHVLIYSEKGR